MGLGKTIQIISLIMADPHKSQQPTLIVAPLSVMSNWSAQAAAHVKTKYAPRVFIYHGQENKGLTPAQFEEYDIVITTYQTMSQELYPYGHKEALKVPSTKGLFSITWRRIVLDEGHQIRNPKAKMTIAACSLKASSRWVLTGTPSKLSRPSRSRTSFSCVPSPTKYCRSFLVVGLSESQDSAP